MLALALALAFADDDLPNLAGEWAPPCMRTVIGTGTCEAIALTEHGGVLHVTEIERSRERVRVVDGRHVFRSSEIRLGPIPVTVDGRALTWTQEDGTERQLRLAEEEPLSLTDGQVVWHRSPS